MQTKNKRHYDISWVRVTTRSWSRVQWQRDGGGLWILRSKQVILYGPSWKFTQFTKSNKITKKKYKIPRCKFPAQVKFNWFNQISWTKKYHNLKIMSIIPRWSWTRKIESHGKPTSQSNRISKERRKLPRRHLIQSEKDCRIKPNYSSLLKVH